FHPTNYGASSPIPQQRRPRAQVPPSRSVADSTRRDVPDSASSPMPAPRRSFASPCSSPRRRRPRKTWRPRSTSSKTTFQRAPPRSGDPRILAPMPNTLADRYRKIAEDTLQIEREEAARDDDEMSSKPRAPASAAVIAKAEKKRKKPFHESYKT